MSQSAPSVPSVVVNSQTSRQQVPLRDYLNARVAPFLKKAITESLGVEAEFPLQWLGECLIHQSILYEGNPDRTNIRERFQYKFEDPQPPEQSAQAQAQQEPPQAPPESVPEAAQPEVPPQAQSEATMTEDVPIAGQEASTVSEVPTEPTISTAEAPVVNGTSGLDTATPGDPKDDDTEMGGTS
ncbi:hypothetical protein PV08_04287 [Exophiala spinifera]|uniref:Uncharacterized protein n=1 Tax=Exophiala spinifera TaxID=91928 RepID=A0A0D1YPI4_9EURO|nr:uncharacterized protein PV08_04287 [Exophiala spinifera]KIW17096.1 hypothetical protein PV08_04287 [Exophiala spinifera]